MRPTMIITGGSRGIGAATARASAEDYDLLLTCLTQVDAVNEVADDCRKLGARVVTTPADVSVESDVLAVFALCEKEFGRLDVLVNNAGILGKQGTLIDFDAERIQRTVDVNVVGALLCMREAARRMSTAIGGAGGSIVNVSSRASTLGSPFEYIDYAATKGAIDSATIGLAQELGRAGVRVNAVRPGLIDTDIHASGGEPGRIDRVAPNIPQGRGGTPEEVANLIVWLASDEASYVNGALVDVSGGR